MKVKDVMTQNCIYCDSESTVQDAAKLMAQHDIGFTPIARDDRLIGTLTDRDIVLRGVAEGRDLANTTVAEVMSDQVFYCTEDQDVEDVARNMADLQVRRLPVVTAEKRLVGAISLGDLALRDGRAAQTAFEGIAQHEAH